MSVQTINEPVPLPRFADDLGSFVGRLRARLFATQSKAARHFGFKSHGTISRYESETLRPPLGYLACLIRLYAETISAETPAPEAHQVHFLREVNRAVAQCYRWDEAPLQDWAELCAVADTFMAKRADPTTSPPKSPPQNLEDEAPPRAAWQTLLTGLVDGSNLTYLLGNADKQRSLRNRQAMLKMVGDFWIKGVLENSLHNSLLIKLGVTERREAVNRPWAMVLESPQVRAQSLPPDVKMVDVFEQAGQSLLILGEPGAGKTTMLLDLTRDLLHRAEQDPLFPIPVVFNLASWNGQPLADWLVGELSQKYRLPPKIARPWIENDEILPLLDGLDEVAPLKRETCVAAINRHHRRHFTPLVVCSRTTDYEALPARFDLRSAVVLQPLTRPQIEAYFDSLGPEFRSVRAMLQADNDLLTLARTPLLLSIITLTGGQVPSEGVQGENRLDAYRRSLFETYAAAMLTRKGTAGKLFSDDQTRRWLAWLARQMQLHQETIFQIDQMQPGWLPDQRGLWLYILISRLISMGGGALLIGFVVGVCIVPLLGLWETSLAEPGGWLRFGVTLGLFNWLTLVVIDGIRLKRNRQAAVKNSPPLWKLVLNLLSIGVVFGLIDGLIFRQFGNAVLGVSGGITLGLTYGIAVELRSYRRALLEEIRPVEALKWYNSTALRGGVIGALAGLGAGGLGGWIVWRSPVLMQHWGQGFLLQLAGEAWVIGLGGLFGACLLGLIGAMFGGIRPVSREGRIIPEQGLRLSFRHAGLSWLGVGLVIGVGGGLLFGLFAGWEHTFFAGLALFIGFGSLAALWYGGLDLINHYTLRGLLSWSGVAPLQLAAFLQYSTDRILLHRVGGGYVFIHRLVMDYFADLGTEM